MRNELDYVNKIDHIVLLKQNRKNQSYIPGKRERSKNKMKAKRHKQATILLATRDLRR